MHSGRRTRRPRFADGNGSRRAQSFAARAPPSAAGSTAAAPAWRRARRGWCPHSSRRRREHRAGGQRGLITFVVVRERQVTRIRFVVNAWRFQPSFRLTTFVLVSLGDAERPLRPYRRTHQSQDLALAAETLIRRAVSPGRLAPGERMA